MATKRGNVLTQSWRSKSAVFRMYSALTSNGYSKSIYAVRRQRNLGLPYAVQSYVWAQWAVARWSHKQMNPMLIYLCCIRHNFKFLNTDFVGSINTRNICLILSTIYSFISVSVCIDMGLSALL